MIFKRVERMPEYHRIGWHIVSGKHRRKTTVTTDLKNCEEMVLLTEFESVSEPREGSMIGRYTTGANDSIREKATP